MELKRIAYTPHGTFGVLLKDNIPYAVTLERPWLDNQRKVSCIPEGTYKCLRCRVSPDYMSDSPRFGDTFQIYDVPDRSNILFHKGNLNDDSYGCVLVGEQFGVLNRTPGILASKAGFDEFKRITDDIDQFWIRISS